MHTAARKISLRHCGAGAATVDSRVRHWHPHSAGAIGEVRGGDGRVGQGEQGVGVTITKGRQFL